MYKILEFFEFLEKELRYLIKESIYVIAGLMKNVRTSFEYWFPLSCSVAVEFCKKKLETWL